MQQTIIEGISVIRLKSPLFAQFEITPKCQQNCLFCYNVWKEKGSLLSGVLSRTEVNCILDKLLLMEIFSLIFSGGEPTLYPYLDEAIDKMASKGVEISMISNGLRFSEIGYLKSLYDAGLEDIQISMHHFSEELNDKLTGLTGSFDLTSSGIKIALDLFGEEAINVNMVVTKMTTDEVFGMGEYLQSLGVKNFSAGMVSYSGLAAKNNLLVDKHDLLKVYSQLNNLYEEFGMEVSFTGGMPLCIVPGNGYEGNVYVSNVCDAAINQIVIGPNGGVRPCVEWPISVASALTDDLFEVWKRSPELNEIREYQNTPESCRSCGFVADCHGGCRASAWRFTGDKQGFDPMMEVLDESL
jgi:radical SAM protein with 4Fe4S-binding SPASM domain